jgi:isoquinoline 1-oxidoreductase
LAATGNHFARESHMDDLARAHGMDPLAFRLHNLADERLRAVLIAAAERFGWDDRWAVPGHGYGIAGGTEKGSYIATCVEVAVAPDTGAVQALRLVAAFECGAIVNPRHLENQVEGAVVMGLGGALFEAIRFDGGRILNPRLSEYRVPRFSDVPPIDVVLLDRPDLPSVGAGETPIVAIAPALGNAILDAVGIRLRALPLVPNGLRT